MRVIYGGKRIDFSTGYRIDAAKWDSEKQRMRNGCTNKLKQTASEINTGLLRYYTDVQIVFKEFEVKGTAPTPEQLKQAFQERYKKQGWCIKKYADINHWQLGNKRVFLLMQILITLHCPDCKAQR
jgi:hypothetical protein